MFPCDLVPVCNVWLLLALASCVTLGAVALYILTEPPWPPLA